jgi:hypothetical protein
MNPYPTADDEGKRLVRDYFWRYLADLPLKVGAREIGRKDDPGPSAQGGICERASDKSGRDAASGTKNALPSVQAV